MDSLSSTEIAWTDEQRAELVATASESLQRLTRLVENLLDMSRLQTGALTLTLAPTALEEVVTRSLHAIGVDARRVEVRYGDDLPLVAGDAGLLERIIANLLTNALRYAPAGSSPTLSFEVGADAVDVLVADRGPGIAVEDRDRVFLPFQRLGDTDNTTGIGLGLAVSRGFAEAMGGHVFAEQTPGGGATLVVQLKAAG